MIYIDDKHSIKRDRFGCWQLITKSAHFSKRYKKEVVTEKISYYPNFSQIANELNERVIGGCSSIMAVLVKLDEVNTNLASGLLILSEMDDE